MQHLTEFQLIDYISGEVYPEIREAFRQHLMECDECGKRLAELKSDLNMIKESFPTEPDSVFWASYPVRLWNRMESRDDSVNFAGIQQWITAFLGAAFAAVILIILLSGQKPTEIPMNYEDWHASYIYEPVDFIDDEIIIDEALSEIVDLPDIDFMPVNENQIFDMMEAMSEEELMMLFETMEAFTLENEG